MIKYQLKCVEKQDNCVIKEEPCSIEFELEYNVSTYMYNGSDYCITGELMTAPQVSSCAINYTFCDHDGCRELTPSTEGLISENVTVPVAFLMDYNVTLTVCTNDACFNTTTSLGE